MERSLRKCRWFLSSEVFLSSGRGYWSPSFRGDLMHRPQGISGQSIFAPFSIKCVRGFWLDDWSWLFHMWSTRSRVVCQWPLHHRRYLVCLGVYVWSVACPHSLEPAGDQAAYGADLWLYELAVSTMDAPWIRSSGQMDWLGHGLCGGPELCHPDQWHLDGVLPLSGRSSSRVPSLIYFMCWCFVLYSLDGGSGARAGVLLACSWDLAALTPSVRKWLLAHWSVLDSKCEVLRICYWGLLLDVWSVCESTKVYYHLQPQDEGLDEVGHSGQIGDLGADRDIDLSLGPYHGAETSDSGSSRGLAS